MDFETPSIYVKPPEPDALDVGQSSHEDGFPTLQDLSLERFRTWNEVRFQKQFKALSPPDSILYTYVMKMGDGEFHSESTQTRSLSPESDNPFEMIFLNELEHTFLHFKKPFRFKGSCFPCDPQKIEVYDSRGISIGTVGKKWSCLCGRVRFIGKDGDGKPLFVVRSVGSGTSKFRILQRKSLPVGKIEDTSDKNGSDTDPLSFKVSFEAEEVEVVAKVLMIGAALLIVSKLADK
ncbi:unnamed protein product [Orchesella dallaii]|uniref:Phospholipid scramblase n=1 Tax=Orchesella dallaii TaxID=48710 RepID=A0ABP1Q512_9HEXA